MREAALNGYLETDERAELVSLCEFVASYARLGEWGVQEWRWLIVGSVMSLQGACVCALSGYDTTRTSVLQNDDRKAWSNWLHNPKSHPEPTAERLADPMELLKRVRKKSELPIEYRIDFDDAVFNDCKRLVEFRRDFIHFLPRGWSIDAAGLPRMIDNCWLVIEKLVVIKPTFGHQITDKQKRALVGAVTEVRKSMRAQGTLK